MVDRINRKGLRLQRTVHSCGLKAGQRVILSAMDQMEDNRSPETSGEGTLVPVSRERAWF